MPDQNMAAPFLDPAASPDQGEKANVRAMSLLIVPTLLCGVLFYLLLGSGQGLAWRSVGFWLLCLTVIVPFFWDAVAATLAVHGLFWKTEDVKNTNQSLRIAILLLLYDEPPNAAIERTTALLATLSKQSRHRYCLHILSDSRQPLSVQRETAHFNKLQWRNSHLEMQYSHRPENLDYKAGNIRAWIRSKGHLHDAMLVLDADSVMESQSVVAMADVLASDGGCAMVQSIPRVMPGRTLLQAMQSFASRSTGVNLGRGLALASGGAGNSYGHNSLVRIEAFATSAGLPRLSGEAPFGGVIMSHDFVEAALLRRAGWRVRFAPDVQGSFEDAPETLTAYLARDRRWCHGNLQHLCLLAVPGLAAMSRFHLLQGAMTYLSAPLWFAAMLLWSTLLPVSNVTAVLGPLLVMCAVLLLPRLCGLVSDPTTRTAAALALASKELVLSSILTPMLMFQRTKYVVSIFLGKAATWSRSLQDDVTFASRARFHAGEVVLGALACAAWLGGFASALILIAALPLMLAPVLAQLVSTPRDTSLWRLTHDVP